jgi:hypothetical protein
MDLAYPSRVEDRISASPAVHGRLLETFNVTRISLGCVL